MTDKSIWQVRIQVFSENWCWAFLFIGTVSYNYEAKVDSMIFTPQKKVDLEIG